MHNLLGENPADDLLDYLSLDKRVTPRTPPTFLWRTSDDGTVPAENSLLFALALKRSGVPMTIHSFQHGDHGLGLAQRNPSVSAWTSLCAQWLREIGFTG
jgi:acetyl esterase/lipase